MNCCYLWISDEKREDGTFLLEGDSAMAIVNLLVIFEPGHLLKQNTLKMSTKLNFYLRLIYTSDFRLQFCIKLAYLREYNFFVCLVNLQA
jgi:hypothetical protein